ncbi:12611_t:CDS:2, partial [Dentiscutata erythropus]
SSLMDLHISDSVECSALYFSKNDEKNSHKNVSSNYGIESR